ncbi:hypothetical protein [Methylobacterium oxalidis]|uniref:hypothetical protein n=1 Tax=Methylobacterium oxalidis TaxID=944322 RepID=UPI0033147973
MSGHSETSGRALADAVAAAYAEETRPPLTPELTERVRAAVLPEADPEDPGSIERINRVLDAFEVSLEAVAGPRLVGFDRATGAVSMSNRSEAGRPLRSFGGQ